MHSELSHNVNPVDVVVLLAAGSLLALLDSDSQAFFWVVEEEK
jgi:hypothetical protein